ncbi:SGNH/GDSL hydrolase family protein [Blastopirellula sp. J2-11]|uniref:SGNH/GDSL hydrolase family protein n=1 Tax=Blastopirellula sp. J2-11 TaxID=2943192 RepID=UPI0021C7F11A|nr:SGNH/GDSL hydrolase family protein [Blastopirellula sp. J2-11]UUO06166.1 SGNH/GDSL hydrolase family protein [Blastopirellula sp. J2-11]
MTCPRRFALALAWAVVTLLAATSTQAAAPPLWKDGLVDGDRVVFLGNTFIEREQHEGYLETALTAQYHDRNITFRNLGWSGDDVFGRSRARFGNAEEGWNHLNNSLDLVKPTAAIVCYGSNAAFEGEAGLQKFREGYTRLLAAVERHTKKIMLISPPPIEDLGSPLPNPQAHNAMLAKYRDVIQEIAYEHQYQIVDLTDQLGKKFTPHIHGKATLTSNGVHLTEYGYWEAAQAVAAALGESTPVVVMEKLELTTSVPLTTSAPLPKSSVSYQGEVLDIAHDMIVRSETERNGKFGVAADGENLGMVTGQQLQTGIGANVPKLAAAAEKLRQTIVAKNELFFHRYRPQNETYLFLFRKHEQGNNAVEIPQFDPLIEAKEREIAQLRQPVSLDIRLTPQK